MDVRIENLTKTFVGKKGVETLRSIKDGVNITDRFTIIDEPKRC